MSPMSNICMWMQSLLADEESWSLAPSETKDVLLGTIASSDYIDCPWRGPHLHLWGFGTNLVWNGAIGPSSAATFADSNRDNWPCVDSTWLMKITSSRPTTTSEAPDCLTLAQTDAAASDSEDTTNGGDDTTGDEDATGDDPSPTPDPTPERLLVRRDAPRRGRAAAAPADGRAAERAALTGAARARNCGGGPRRRGAGGQRTRARYPMGGGRVAQRQSSGLISRRSPVRIRPLLPTANPSRDAGRAPTRVRAGLRRHASRAAARRSSTRRSAASAVETPRRSASPRMPSTAS